MLNNLGRKSFEAAAVCLIFIFVVYILAFYQKKIFVFFSEYVYLEAVVALPIAASMFSEDVLQWCSPYRFRYMLEFYEPLLSSVLRSLQLSPSSENILGACMLFIPVGIILLSLSFALKSLAFENAFSLNNWGNIFDWKSIYLDFLSVFHVVIFIVGVIIVYTR